MLGMGQKSSSHVFKSVRLQGRALPSLCIYAKGPSGVNSMGLD